MNKTTYVLLLILTLILTACSGNSNAAGPISRTQTGPSGELSASMQVAIGTIQLDETSNAITAEQAAELLPLWETLQDLYGSDTAANQEIEALIAQIQDTMTDEQTQAVSAMNLTRQDMFAIMQSQGLGLGAAQNGNSSTNNNSGGFGPGAGGFQGPPPDGGGFPGSNPNFQGEGSRTQSTDSTNNSNTQTTVNPNRIPTPLIQAVIDYLKKKAGA